MSCFISAKNRFQSTLPRGERHRLSLATKLEPNFNPRSHEGSDRCRVVPLLRPSDFNPRSHEGSDSLLLYKDARCDIFQSTLPRGERQDIAYCKSVTIKISIHAPTRGATRIKHTYRFYYLISIHAPTRGATLYADYKRGRITISIHAPTRGATGTRCRHTICWIYFNPRSHEGSDVLDGYHPSTCRKFQSTLPRGERLIALISGVYSLQNFNPRSHEGSDYGRR